MAIVFGTNGSDLITGFDDQSDTLYDFENFSNRDLENGSDTLIGGGGNDSMNATFGNDWLQGGAGNDQLAGGRGNDTLLGGDGDDLIYGNGGGQLASWGGEADLFDGGDGNDTLINAAYFGETTMLGGAGNDTINVSDFAVVDGGDGIDRISVHATATAALSLDFTDLWTGGTGLLAGHSVSNVEIVSAIGGSSEADHIVIGAGYTGNFAQGIFKTWAGNDTVVSGGGNDWIYGGDGDDVVYGLAGVDFLVGEQGNDSLDGGAGDDRLFGQAGNNTLIGGDGHDYLQGDEGDDSLNGGAGNDSLIGGAGANTLSGGLGNDTYNILSAATTSTLMESANAGIDLVVSSQAWTLAANFENLTIYTGDNINGTGNSLANTIIGGNGNNSISGMAGTDLLMGEGGNDTLNGGSGADTMGGGQGDDLYIVDGSGDVVDETMSGSGGIDTVQASANHTLSTNVENLVIFGAATSATGNASANSITGNAQSNLLQGLDGNDVLDGGSFNDTLKGGNGNDTLIGGVGSDVLDGGTGADSMTGGLGSESYTVDDAGDLVIELVGEGADSVTASISYTLAENVETLILTSTAASGTGNAMNNLITGSFTANTLSGGDGQDTINAGGAADVVHGDLGNDLLNGEAGADTLNGGDGNDRLVGGTGLDSMAGGLGADRFVFDDGDTGTTQGNADLITDFTTVQGDRIDLSLVDAIAGGADDAFTYIGAAAFTGVAGQLRVSVITGNSFVQGDTDGDSVADVWIRLDGTPALLASHFVL